jgi:acetyl esterase/lipase
MTTHDIDIGANVEYLRRGDASLKGTLYTPKGEGPFPCVIAVHGGGWRLATTDVFNNFAPWLASQGYVVFTPTYTQVKKGEPSYPAAIQDIRAAVQFMRGKAAEFNIAADRIALMGESAGGHLASMVALAGDDERFRADIGAFPDVSTKVKAVAPIYGIYDLAAQWRWDQTARAGEHITTPFLGKSLLDDRRIYFDASPLSYVTTRADAPAFFVVWGELDDVCDPRTQSIPFFEALKQAKFYARSMQVAGAPHYWMADPLDDPGSYPGFFAPRLLRFLRLKL